jgi:hypothetical protein
MNSEIFKEIRRVILEKLYLHQWTEIEDEQLFKMLMDAKYEISLPQVQGHLRYLQDQKYVLLEEISINQIGLVRNMAQIAVAGIDFIENNAPDDPGVTRRVNPSCETLPEIRGWILMILYRNLPEWTGEKLISQILTQGAYLINPIQVINQFKYLEAKGLIELKTANMNELSLTRHLAKILNPGINLVERTNIEPVAGVAIQ